MLRGLGVPARFEEHGMCAIKWRSGLHPQDSRSFLELRGEFVEEGSLEPRVFRFEPALA
jgi:hypothetical protein